MPSKKNGQGEVHGKVFCFGGGRYCINEKAPKMPNWLSATLLSDIIGMTGRNLPAINEHTRKEMKKDSVILAKALLALGIKRGDHLLISNNSYPAICFVYAAARIGVIAVPFDEHASDGALIDFILKRKTDTFLVINNKTPDFAADFCEKTAYKCKKVISINDIPKKSQTKALDEIYYDFSHLTAIAKKSRKKLPSRCSTGEPIMLGSSSGTSGEAKFFPYTDKNIIYAALSSRAASKMPLFSKKREIWLAVVPLERPYGLLTSVLVPSWGRREIRLMKPTDEINDTLREVDVISCAPDFVDIVEEKLTISGYDLTEDGNEKPITFIIGGASLPAEKIEHFRTFLHQHGFDAKLCCGYGTSESCGCISVAVGSTYRPDTVGRLCPGVKVWLRREDGKPYKLGDIGRLWVSGENVIEKYDSKIANEKNLLIDDNGERWVDTGDYMSLAPSGYLTFHHSDKDFYFTERHDKIFPKKAEGLISSINGVKKCWVIGDEKRSLSAAFIAPEENTDPDELIDYICENIHKLKTENGDLLTTDEVPKYYRIVKLSDLQENEAGKRSKATKDKLLNLVKEK